MSVAVCAVKQQAISFERTTYTDTRVSSLIWFTHISLRSSVYVPFFCRVCWQHTSLQSAACTRNKYAIPCVNSAHCKPSGASIVIHIHICTRKTYRDRDDEHTHTHTYSGRTYMQWRKSFTQMGIMLSSERRDMEICVRVAIAWIDTTVDLCVRRTISSSNAKKMCASKQLLSVLFQCSIL